MTNSQRDVIVIGGGLSGGAAALQAASFGLNVLVISKPNEPGYWSRTGRVPHYPGAPENISGKDLIDHIRMQGEKAGASFIHLLVTNIEKTDKNTFKVHGEDSQVYEAPVIVIASGVSKDAHFLAGERELVGRGIYYSVINEAPYLRHQSSIIIGKSEETARATLELTKYVEKIYFVIPSSKLDLPEKLQRDLESNTKIEQIFSSSIKKFNGTDELHSATILSAGSEREIKIKSAFIYTYNLIPCTEFAKKLVKTDEQTGRILVNSDFSTSEQGVFACGDVLCGTLQHPGITSAQGLIVAVNAKKFLGA